MVDRRAPRTGVPGELSEVPEIFRVSAFGRWASAAYAAFFGGFGVFVSFLDGYYFLGAAWIALHAVVVWRLAFYPRIVITHEVLEVWNPILRYRVALIDIEDCDSGYQGIEIRRRSGRNFSAWAVQRSNFMWLIRRKVRSDHVVARINEARRRAANGGSSSSDPT